MEPRKRSIILMRHCERLDRAMEKRGEDWISTAARPHDSPLSELGIEQAAMIGQQLRSLGIRKIYSSPLIRAVQTSHVIAEQLGFGENSVLVEPGIVEQARSFRGKQKPEPLPTWNPLLLPVSELKRLYSDKIDETYPPLVNVSYERDVNLLNELREIGEEGVSDEDIIVERSKKFLARLMKTDFETVLVVGHGATTKNCEKILQTGLSRERHIVGERAVSSWAEFQPVDTTNLEGPWYAPGGLWNQCALESRSE